MSRHPYQDAPDRAFWSRSVAAGFEAPGVADDPGFRLTRQDRFMSAGSCFAANVRRYLERHGYAYTVTEGPHPAWPESAETLYYEAFSARYGNVYTARQMVQLVERALGRFRPTEAYWVDEDGTYIDPFRPGLAHRARSEAEFTALTVQHLAAVAEALRRSTVLVFTLGLTEAWVSAADGAVFPACPGTVSGAFDAERHRFVNFTVEEVTADLLGLVDLVREVNPAIKVVLTVSPVPLVATATDRHVLVATTYSKSVLRVAADAACRRRPEVAYFPAYELVTGPQARGQAFEPDLRNVREPAVAAVMEAFFASLCAEGPQTVPAPGRAELAERLAAAAAATVAAECEEMMADADLVAAGRAGSTAPRPPGRRRPRR